MRLPLPGDTKPLVLGLVLEGMNVSDPPVTGKLNQPSMPVAWVRTYKGARVFTTTMGASEDLKNEGVRRMLVNACYWAAGLEGHIPARSRVGLVGDYNPSPFKFGGFRRGLRPSDLR